MLLNVFRADPAGNLTLFVLDAVAREKRAEIAKELMERSAVEQVAFVTDAPQDADGAIEMMGGEFCGNAARAFGAYLCKKTGKNKLFLRVSGCEKRVFVEVSGGNASAQMPLPQGVRSFAEGTLVDLGGIVHFVTEEAPSEEYFARIEREILCKTGAEAYGVIFLNKEENAITPLIKVVPTDTLIWESSCGSGSLATAVAQSAGWESGDFFRTYSQPAGSISVELKWRDGALEDASIGGKVCIEEEITVEI